MKSQQIRQTFLDFFKSKGHTIKPSDGLIPSNDPTLLFTTAGMVQFKQLYAGAPLEFKRAATVQKSFRAGGKGSDLENVGRTLRHHTFFEMLGNFSFGDYFKKEAIEWAWELIIDGFKMNKDQLWVSIYQDDDEAFEIWNKGIGFPSKKIVRMGKKDNFWGPAGNSGACGPCSEIYFDLGPSRSCGKPDCAVGCDCERYLEFWNLVFPQFFQEPDGRQRPLERRGIDTGMGLERLSFLLQKVGSNYETDLFRPIVEEVRKHTLASYEGPNKAAFHVIADHSRALTFTLSENILPSNEGRGYVLRRILRRAVRYAKKIGITKPFLYQMIASVVETMKEPYPELIKTREQVANIVKSEEERFFATLAQGSEILDGIVQRAKNDKKSKISGKDMFLLYDTYGMPLDLTREVADEEGLQLDEAGFEAEMAQQKTRARASWAGNDAAESRKVYEEIRAKIPAAVEFLGYQGLTGESTVLAIVAGGKEVSQAKAGDEVQVVLAKTPFYAEGGGQVGDQGEIRTPSAKLEVLDVRRPVEGLIVHFAKVQEGTLKTGDKASAAVDGVKRLATMRHHTGTHILQSVLRQVLGNHVKQAGSLVAPDRLRFDFTHFKALDSLEIARIETLVNERIMSNAPVDTSHMDLEEVKRSDIIALFDEKYGDKVRVVNIGGFSKELCGGTHLKSSGQIGYFKILSDSSIAAGVRRLEAVCGDLAVRESLDQTDILRDLASMLKVKPKELLPRVEKLMADMREMAKSKQQSARKEVQGSADDLLKQVKDVDGVPVLAALIPDAGVDVLRGMGDMLKQKIAGIIVLGGALEGKVSLVAMVHADLVKKGFSASDILKKVAPIAGGSGGGKPEMAQAGGKDASKLPDALAAVEKAVKESFSKK